MREHWITDIGLADKGRVLVNETLRDMSGINELRKTYKDTRPLGNIHITGCISVTHETAAFIALLQELGASVRWCPDNRLASIDSACAYIASRGIPIFAKSNMTEQEQLWSFDQAIKFENGKKPKIILDDGCDITFYLHETQPEIYKEVIGTCEQTTCGIVRDYKLQEGQRLLTAVIDVNSSATKSKFDNIYGSRESLIEGIHESLNIQIAGKQAVVFGFGETGRGCAMALRNLGAHVAIVEIDPIMAMIAHMEGYEIMSRQEACKKGHLFVTATGCIKTINGKDIRLMQDGAVLMNMGHGDMEINTQYLGQFPKENIDKHLDKFIINKRAIYLLAQGRLVNMVAGKGHPPRVMSMTFTNHFLALMELLNNREKYKKGEIYQLPRMLDEEAARLNFPEFRQKLARLSLEQARYIGVSIDGPYKRDDYRY